MGKNICPRMKRIPSIYNMEFVILMSIIFVFCSLVVCQETMKGGGTAQSGKNTQTLTRRKGQAEPKAMSSPV